MPGRVVGAICPPVMPKLALLMKITVRFSPRACGMDDLTHADRSQVAVALIGEDDAIRQDTLDAGCHGRRASVRRFDEIGIEIVVGKHRASHRRNADRLVDQIHLFQHFGDQAMRHAMRTARAIMGWCIGKTFGSFVNQIIWSSLVIIHLYACVMRSSQASRGLVSTRYSLLVAMRSISRRISSGNGTTPPMRP